MNHLRQLVILVAGLFAAAGCSGSRSGQLVLTPDQSGRNLSQKFSEAYATQNDDGSFEFVLIADDPDRREQEQTQKRNAPGAPLEPSSVSPLRQLVHVKIPWLPERGNISETIVSNAAVDWYILSDVPDRQQDVIQYSGAGFGLAYPSDKTIDLNLKSAKLKPQIVRGGLKDPLGHFQLTGDIRARRDSARVRDLVADARRRISPAR